MQFSDLLVILLITAGATKAAAFFIAQAASLSRQEKLTIVTRALAIQAGVLGIFAWRGENILKTFHVSVAALEVAGGLVLLLFALPFDIRGYMYYLNTRYAHLAAALLVVSVPVLDATW